MAGGIEVTAFFDMKTSLPLDGRFVAADNTARDAIASGVRFEGLLVYVTSTKKMWQLQGGITNSDWYEAGGGGGGGFNNIVTKTASATILSTEDCILVNAASGNITLTLPASALKEQHNFKRIDSVETNTVTIQSAGSDTIDGQTSITLPYQYSTVKLVGIATNLWGLF